MSTRKSKKPASKTAVKSKSRASRSRLIPRPRNLGKKTAAASRTRPAFHLPDFWTKISLDRKLDALGIGIAAVGLLTLFSLLASNQSQLLGRWIDLLNQIFGWGMYLLTLGSICLGLWLVLRRFDKLPELEPLRLIGLMVSFFVILSWFHFFLFPPDRTTSFALAEEGKGGGYAGATLLGFLQPSFGWAGTAVILIAASLIVLAIIADVPVTHLFAWTKPISDQIHTGWENLTNRKSASSLTSDLPEYVGSRKMNPAGMNMGESQPESYSPGQFKQLDKAHFGSEHKQWILPPLDEILEVGDEVSYDDEIDRQRARLIEETLASFGAPGKVVEISRGPTITQFGVEPGFIDSRNGSLKVRVGKIAALADDLALALSAKRIRIQAPVPSKGYVGIEVPNEAISLVALRDVMESEVFRKMKSPLRFALGQDVAGKPVSADLAVMPHLLVAGATGSGKSVCVNALICCLLLNNTPDDLRILMVDPKRVELAGYNGIPHLLAPVVVELDRVVGSLQWVAREMDQRYHKLAQVGARNIEDYNRRIADRGERKLPRLVVIIDELADLMMLAPDETERTITRLAQLARATGIHLVIATQRPSVDVVTGLIKANFPSRVAFAVASGVDSRVILDQPGAERLLGRGDMLFQAPDAASPVRLQGVFVSEGEIQNLVSYWRQLAGILEPSPTATGGIVDDLPSGIPLKQIGLWEEMAPEEEKDPLYDEAVDLVRRQGRASISMLQRRLRIGYTRAARLIESMQEKGIIGLAQPGAQGLEVLDYGPAAPPVGEE